MDLYLVKGKSDSTYWEGRYQVIEGYYGPVPLHVAEQFRAILGGELINVGHARHLLFLMGQIKPYTDGDFQIVNETIARLQAVVQAGRAVEPDDIVFPPAPEVEPVAEEEVIEEGGDFDYAGALDEMKAADYDYVTIHGIRARPKKTEAQEAYAAFKAL